ncbi:hypothetical protein AZI87_16420 [Bdellovibrio bacteriovorus]|uniref:HYDIN/VesB/CFA65-like Ig-like domain-containing protein n=1 Tax=Bdellovibrio bacteriovorus TaxID=959 RepID=A0A162FZC4_BDEBC|nr:hypothetical protein [Bdellovibrio bacteriovorus]KYG62853.1 hypothetical protein AZI87_16420 [Bdellovibrio bacteriovorus]
MKALLFAFLTTLAVSSAHAEEINPVGGTEVIYMGLGSAPYNGTARGSLQLKNTGDQDITKIVWDIKGMGFSAQDNCPTVLKPGKSCQIFVTYWNTFAGPASGTLLVWTSDKNYRVNLSAYGQEPIRPPNPPVPPRFP